MNLFRLYTICSLRLRTRLVRRLRFIGLNVHVDLPYDNTNPVVYIKDDAINCYTDDYVMALASAGSIHLVGIITSSSIAPFNRWVTSDDYEQFVVRRAEGVSRARSSGFRNIPDPVRGVKGHLQKPSSGKIEDTQPVGSEGSWLVVNAARQATATKPLVVVAGGPLTTVADAYVLDNSIADKVIVAWIDSGENHMGGYNGWADPWSAYIVLQKLRLVQFPVWQVDPQVRKSRLTELPSSELRQWMTAKQHSDWKTPDGDVQPGSRDADAPPAISVMRKDYALQGKRVSFSHWIIKNGHELAAYKVDRDGRALIVTCADRRVATEEWWRALKNPAAYKACG